MVSLYPEKKTNKYIRKSLPGNALPIVRQKLHFLISCFYKGTPRCACLPGVFTLEAAVILPLAACFFVAILFFFRVMQVELEVQKALDLTGRKLAVSLTGEEETNEIALGAAAEALFLKELSGRPIVAEYVKGGNIGISLVGSSLDGDDVELLAAYRIRFPVRLLGLYEVRAEQHADCRKWTGWKAAEDAEGQDVWVYITETGTVYHLTDACTYLNLSIRQADAGAVAWMRNKSGGKYRECELCGEGGSQGIVYVTDYGDRYHCDLNCSGLKRTIFKIRLSEAGERRACSKCGAQQ